MDPNQPTQDPFQNNPVPPTVNPSQDGGQKNPEPGKKNSFYEVCKKIFLFVANYPFTFLGFLALTDRILKLQFLSAISLALILTLGFRLAPGRPKTRWDFFIPILGLFYIQWQLPSNQITNKLSYLIFALLLSILLFIVIKAGVDLKKKQDAGLVEIDEAEPVEPKTVQKVGRFEKIKAVIIIFFLLVIPLSYEAYIFVKDEWKSISNDRGIIERVCGEKLKKCPDGTLVAITNLKCEYAPCPSPVACTMEAKQCPDGSYVSRKGPKCEFAPCPTPSLEISSNWKTYSNKEFDFEIKYPENLLVERQIACPKDYVSNKVLLDLYKKDIQCLVDIPSAFIIYNDNSEKEPIADDNCYTMQKEQILINGVKAEKLRTTFHFENKECASQGIGPGFIWEAKIFIVENGTTFVIRYDSSSQIDEIMFDKIISTFRFQ